MTQDLPFNPVTFLERAAHKTGFVRERYVERDIPTDLKDVLIIFFFGDYKSRFLLSSLLLKNYIKKVRRPRYCILCSWNGDQGLYPYVNEYWSLANMVDAQEIALSANGFNNTHKELSVYQSNLLRYFPGDVLDGSFFNEYYNRGFTKKFMEQYSDINYYLPSIPSLPLDIARRLSKIDKSVFIHPSRKIKIWANGGTERVFINVKFWELLTWKLIQHGITPVCLYDVLSYDISPIFAERCLYVNNTNTLNILSVMRAVDCVLDVCSGISRLAIMARTPFMLCDSRKSYFDTNEIELDDLCASKIQRDYTFLFSDAIENDWSFVTDLVMTKLNRFIPTIDKNKLLSSSEFDDNIEYTNVSKKKSKKMGLHFVKVNSEKV